MNDVALVRRLASSGRRFLLKSVVVDLSSSDERTALVWSWFYIFALFLAYYILRPIREELGVSGGVRNLPCLFSGTLAAMGVANIKI